MTSSTNAPRISLQLPGHGVYEASPAAVDAAMQRYLPSSPEQLRAIVQQRSGLEVGFTDVHDASAFLVVLADFIEGEWAQDVGIAGHVCSAAIGECGCPRDLRIAAERAAAPGAAVHAAIFDALTAIDDERTATPFVVDEPGSTSLRMNLAALHVLRGEGWDLSPNAGGSFAVEQLDDDTALVTIHTTECQSVDLVDAARHCLHLANVDDSIVVVSHDGSVVESPRPALLPMTFTTRAFERSHGRKPSRTSLGTWAFQQTRSEYAYEAEMIGEPWFAPGMLTLAQAKRAARQHFAANSIVAVLP